MLTNSMLLLLNVVQVMVLTLGEERIVCGKNRTLLETPGDAVLSVFVDANNGLNCNTTSIKGFEEISTALYVVQALDKYDYVPGLDLGLRVFDTCHDEMTVYKQALQAAAELDCDDHYELGILVPNGYSTVLEPIRNYSLVPISTYSEQNLTRPLINVIIHYLATRFEVVDLVLANANYVLEQFMEATRDAGICVKNYGDIDDLEDGTKEAVIAVLGNQKDISGWIKRGETVEGPRKTYVVLPLDGSHVDELLPAGSYVIQTEPFDFDLLEEFSQGEDFLGTSGNSVVHSSHLLGIGKAIVELAQVFQDLQKRSCSRGESCVMPRFNPNHREEIRNSDVYDALRILPKAHSIKYIVSMKSHQELTEVAAYRLEAAKFRVTPETRVPRMPRLCLKKFVNNCAKCLNFQKKYGTGYRRGSQRTVLKPGNWIPIFLTVVACGTFACIIILIFVIYRFLVEEVLDGNPTLTILLTLANIFTLQTVIPFCMEDDYFGAEHLNSRKIFVSTLTFGILFSIMLSRALFLAFSKGGIFTTHINGYLQCLMVFFMSGVQIAISTTYFALSTTDSAMVVRHLDFIPLLSYDMFLLATLFVVCCFTAQIQRNYKEGRSFFGTAIGLLIAWAIWLTCFILMEPHVRDIVVCFGIISTAYLIIIGVLIPRTYYMAKHMGTQNVTQRFQPDLGTDPRLHSLGRQRPFYDYVHSGAGATNINNLQVPQIYPNYYGGSSPSGRHVTLCTNPDPRRTPGYNNYAFHSEMREMENSSVIPRVCVENADVRRSPIERGHVDSAGYARPRSNHRKQKMILQEKDCIETAVYVEGRLSPSRRRNNEAYPSRSASPKLGLTEATIREEEECDITRITRF